MSQNPPTPQGCFPSSKWEAEQLVRTRCWRTSRWGWVRTTTSNPLWVTEVRRSVSWDRALRPAKHSRGTAQQSTTNWVLRIRPRKEGRLFWGSHRWTTSLTAFRLKRESNWIIIGIIAVSLIFRSKVINSKRLMPRQMKERQLPWNKGWEAWELTMMSSRVRRRRLSRIELA
jgi:hypothetical protein